MRSQTGARADLFPGLQKPIVALPDGHGFANEIAAQQNRCGIAPGP
jgi:hypothetical protein